MRKIREKWQDYMLRPFIYMTFTRFVLALAAALLIDFFLAGTVGRPIREPVFLLTAALFVLLAVIAWMRLDGVRLPKLMMLRVNPRKKPSRMYGDMSDHIDEKPMLTFEDLDDGEKDVCIFGADAVCCVIFFIVSFFVS